MDDDVEFQELKIKYGVIGIKLTMREFKQIQQFIKKYQENHPNSSHTSIKNDLLKLEENKQIQQEHQKMKKQEVVNALYHQWDEDDDFFIKNINQSSQQRSAEQTVIEEHTSTNRDYACN